MYQYLGSGYLYPVGVRLDCVVFGADERLLVVDVRCILFLYTYIYLYSILYSSIKGIL